MVMRALVTGAAGFVGRHFCDRLRRDGWDLHCADIADPRSPVDCREVFAISEERYDLVLHAAAVVGGIANIHSAPMSVAVDLELDAAMWQWALRTRPRHVVYFSSSYAYPERTQTAELAIRQTEYLVDFDDLRQPDSIYGWVKVMGEYQARLVRAEGVNVTVVRPFSGYGGDQDLAYPFPTYIERAVRHSPTFHVWGDGQQVRDWVHIDDVVDGTLALLDAGVNDVVNLCTGRGTTFDELARIVCGQIGYEPDLFHDLTKPVGVRYRVGDPTLMRTVYEPRISLEEGVARALAAHLDSAA